MPRHSRGFSLVEAVVSVSILAITAVIVLGLLQRQTDYWEFVKAEQELEDELKRGMRDMTNELRSASRTRPAAPPNAVIPNSPNNTQIIFYLPEDTADDTNTTIIDDIGYIQWNNTNPIVYQYDANLKELQRVEGVNTQVLARDVTSLQFDDQTTDASLYSDEVRIAMTLQRITPQQRTVTTSANSVIQLRN